MISRPQNYTQRDRSIDNRKVPSVAVRVGPWPLEGHSHLRKAANRLSRAEAVVPHPTTRPPFRLLFHFLVSCPWFIRLTKGSFQGVRNKSGLSGNDNLADIRRYSFRKEGEADDSMAKRSRSSPFSKQTRPCDRQCAIALIDLPRWGSAPMPIGSSSSTPSCRIIYLRVFYGRRG